ncbi:hypothetical protein Adeh_1038 [Anaeromyxobacter dehalogenans 2CP-C]|uniref:Uncharacterized protein n=1 Tax=Anaeromyxobacter dehalogenans (strain 2CP-C) TaxID=290397 RepID=Q2IPT0_ANADE|nr:hypothetical protein Adeh_1038 [Anaeromyxobacter dehalogenans 2CP-C]
MVEKVRPAGDDAATLAALGDVLDDMAEIERLRAEDRQRQREAEREAVREAAERAAWDALPLAEKERRRLAAFDAAVDELRQIHPGYSTDAAQRIVAARPEWAGWNPHDGERPDDVMTPGGFEDRAGITGRLAAEAEAQPAADFDPLSDFAAGR